MSINTECYWGDIPEMHRHKLIELYNSPYCTQEYINSFCVSFSLNCFSIYEEGQIKEIIIFHCDKKKKKIIVLNRLFSINVKYLNIFSEFIFHVLKEMNSILIHHLLNPIYKGSIYPIICNTFGEDYIIHLPTTKKEYFSKFSFNQQDHTKRSISKIVKTFINYEIKTFEKENISEAIVNKIVEMNHLRIKEKNTASDIDSNYRKSIIDFVKYYGFVSVLEIEGKIVAGVILYLIGNQYFLETISHDPEYNKFSVGHVCLYLTILNCIDKNGQDFHLLWGESRYKRSFLGEKVPLFSLTIFRSHFKEIIFIYTNKINSTISNYMSYSFIKAVLKKNSIIRRLYK